MDARRQALSAAALLAGCVAGPDYRAPSPPEFETYTAGPQELHTAAAPGPAGAAQHFEYGTPADLSAWWQRFDAPQLSALIERAFAGNFDLQAAQARLREAQHLLDAQRGTAWPSVGVNASATRRSATGAGAAGSIAAPAPSADSGDAVFNVVTASGVVSYDLDAAGGRLRRIEAQSARVEAARHQLRAASLALAGNVVSSAVDAARLSAQIDTRTALIDVQQQRVQLIELRVDEGAAARAELIAARADLAATRAPLPALEQARDAATHRLALLVGAPPAGFDAPHIALADLRLPVEIPVRLPAQLVRVRPDIRAAEGALHAASAQIGVAAADLYPRITLDASYGVVGIDAGGGLSFSPLWSLGASLLAPVFEGGRLRAQRDAAIAAYDATLAEYRQTVLHAFTEVADALRALQGNARTLAAQYEAYVAARDSMQMAEFRFEEGVASHLEVLVLQQQYQQAAIAYVDARAQRLSSTALLFAALGGAAP